MPSHLAAFVGISLALAIAPGPDFALVMKNALVHGRRGVLLTVAGLGGGVGMWIVATAVGVATLLRASSTAYTAIKVAGAVYLGYLGVRTLIASWHAREPDAQTLRPVSRRAAVIWRQGLISASLNPKLGVFFVTFLPQFIDSSSPPLPQLFLLGGIFAVIGLSWMLLAGLAVHRIGEVVASSRVRRWMERTTGVVLVGFAARLAADRA